MKSDKPTCSDLFYLAVALLLGTLAVITWLAIGGA